MEWFGNENPQLLKAGGTLYAILEKRNEKMTVTKKEYKEKLLKTIEVQNRLVTDSKYFDITTKEAFINHSKSFSNLLTNETEKEKLTLTQLKSLTNDLLTYWNESISIDTEFFWIALKNNNIDFERKNPLDFAIIKNRFRTVEQGIGAKKYWGEIKEIKTVKDRFSKDEIEKIEKIIEIEENTRFEILNKCLTKKEIPQTQYLKFGECMAYFANCKLFDKYFNEKQVDDLYEIWKNFESKR